MFKKLLLSLIFIGIVATGCATQKPLDDYSNIMKKGEVVVGVKTDAKPFGFYNQNHQLQGYDIDLAHEITKALFGNKNKVKFVPVTTSTRILKLEDEEVDMLIATMSVTPQRSQLLDFSNPYYVSGQSMLVRKNSKIKHLSDLENKHVIIVFGSTSENNVTTHVPSAIIYGYRTYSEAWKAFKSGKG